MASAAAGEDTPGEEDKCSICHEDFTQPKILHCGHLVCEQCLISWLKSNHKASCPLCRSTIVELEDKHGDKTFEEYADGLPTDLTTESLIETRRLLKQTHACQVCVTQEAKSICITCADFFCPSCVKGHKRSTVSSHHTITELSELTAQTLASSRSSPCSVHAWEWCRVYCPAHQASICLLCASTIHRQCSDVMLLDTKVEEECTVLENLQVILGEEENLLEVAIDELNRCLQTIEKDSKQVLVEIDTNIDILDAALKARRQRLKEICHSTFADAKNWVTVKKSSLLQRKGEVITNRQVVKHTRLVTNFSVVSPMTAAMRERVSEVVYDVKAHVVPIVIPTVSLMVEPKQMKRLEQEILDLGKMKNHSTTVLSGKKGITFLTDTQQRLAKVLDGLTSFLQIPSTLALEIFTPVVFQFHNNHGKNVKLTNDQMTAEWTGDTNGIAIAAQPMQCNVVYNVVVERDGMLWSGTYTIGVVTESPDAIVLPKSPANLTSAVVLQPSAIYVNGVKKEGSSMSVLKLVKKGSCIGLFLDSVRNLHFHMDGQWEMMVAENVSHPCHFFVDLDFSFGKVKTKPLEPMPDLPQQ